MDASPLLNIFYKIHTNQNNDVVEKYIIFDEETECAFIYCTDRRVPAKLYIEPIYGELRKNIIKSYTSKNGYQLAATLYMNEGHEKSVTNYNVICRKDRFSDHMNHVCKKFNDYAYDERDTVLMCTKLRTCLRLYKQEKFGAYG